MQISAPQKALFLTHLRNRIPIEGEDFERALTFFELVGLRKKEYLLRPGQVCRHETFILKGLLQSGSISADGKRHALYFPHEDWWVGDFKSFSAGTTSSMEILALEDCQLLRITKESLERLFLTLPVFERFFRILNEKAGIALQERLLRNLDTGAEEQYEQFLERYPQLLQRLTHKQIASFLGVTPEYFSRMRKK